MRRQLRVELLRGTAPAAALVMFGASVWMFAVHQDDWAGRWAGLASWVRQSMLILVALMVAAGAWQAGRERRRQIGDLLASTARPAWQPMLVGWLAVSLAGTAGLLAALAGAAVLVGRLATYVGGDWWWTLAVGVLALWTASALGVLVGRLVPLRVAAPIAGLAAYVGLGIATYLPVGAGAWLTPGLPYGGVERLVPDGTHLRQTAWFVALTALLLAVAARRIWVALVCGALAAASVVPIVTGPLPRHFRTDLAAVEPVCTVEGPQVCVARINAYLLDDVAAVVQPVLRRVDGIPGAPWRAADAVTAPPGHSTVDDDGTIWVGLDGQSKAFGGLERLDWLRASTDGFLSFYCGDGPHDQGVYDATMLARSWLHQEPPYGDVPIDRLLARPMPQQRAWFAEYLAASRVCDLTRLSELARVP
ncbi:hypothetical protein [Polymorphospora sp. NPDC050346]|uniref:hypothetical protein n=1 Tax=Polymorphospora sp. NPDC050346 TaxID=3155780 RepID=UPI0033D68E2E